MLAGSEGLGGIVFEDYRLAFRLGTAALVLILFDGGLNTPKASLRQALWPALSLATVGVAITAGVLAVGVRLLGFGWPEALLLGAVVSSTDAAAVFAVLRASGVQLKKRVGATLELESGLNDPMAVILTLSFTAYLAGNGGEGVTDLLLQVPLQLAIGGLLGVGFGIAGRKLLRVIRLPVGGLYPVLTLALALFAFSVPTLLPGSGFLAVYLTGMVIGNAEIPYRTGIVRFHDALAWCGQVAMFLMMGLLVFPSRLLEVAPVGLAVGLILALVARPLAVVPILLPFRFPARETALVAWVGLRGAVPIILATFPVLEGVPGAERLFDVVFFVVVVSAVIPGGTVSWTSRRLGVHTETPAAPPAVLEMSTTRKLNGVIGVYYVEPALPVANVPIQEVPLEGSATVMLIIRGDELIAPRGDTVLLPGDFAYLFYKQEDRALVDLLFGRPEE